MCVCVCVLNSFIVLSRFHLLFKKKFIHMSACLKSKRVPDSKQRQIFVHSTEPLHIHQTAHNTGSTTQVSGEAWNFTRCHAQTR